MSSYNAACKLIADSFRCWLEYVGHHGAFRAREHVGVTLKNTWIKQQLRISSASELKLTKSSHHRVSLVAVLELIMISNQVSFIDP